MLTKIHLDIHVVTLIIFCMALSSLVPSYASNLDSQLNFQRQLENGKVIVGLKDVGHIKYVTASVLINAPPDKVWPIIVNPFEFQGKITPRIKTIDVVTNQNDRSVLKFTLDVLLIPNFTYTVESVYDSGEKIQFHSVGGMLKDFRGSWIMTPVKGGNQTELAYCMYIDPGFFVPQWMMREAVKSELPKTLIALRERIGIISKQPTAKEHRTILAAVETLPRHESMTAQNSN